jgi:uncharacterized protein YlxP (DUF503 family)
MVAGLCKLEFFLPEIHSLKEKRMILRSLKEKTFQKFKVPVAEVGHQDLWQRAEIGFSVVGSDRRVIASLMEQITDFIERLDQGQVTQRSMEIVDF